MRTTVLFTALALLSGCVSRERYERDIQNARREGYAEGQLMTLTDAMLDCQKIRAISEENLFYRARQVASQPESDVHVDTAPVWIYRIKHEKSNPN